MSNSDSGLMVAVLSQDQIGPALTGQLFGLLLLPAGYFCMITRKQHGRDFPALPLARPGILGVFQQAVLKTLFTAGCVIAHDAGQQADDGIQHNVGGWFTT